MTRLGRLPLGTLLASLAVFGCEREAPRPVPPAEPAEAPASTPPPAPKGPPSLSVDKSGALVGGTRVGLDTRDAFQRLEAELQQHKQFLDGQEVKVAVERQVKPRFVGSMLAALGNAGVSRALIRTDTRSEFPSEVGFVPLAKAKSAPGCSVVAMILEDRGTAAWKLAGGVAGKRGKGMAGPDLTLTGETIERLAKGCPEGTIAFVSAAEGVEWGLVFDLAASTRRLSKASFASLALLPEPPVPGRAVTLP